MKITDHSDDTHSPIDALWNIDKFPTVEVIEIPDLSHNAPTRRPADLILKFTRLDEYHANALKKVAEKLPQLIHAVRAERFAERLKSLLAAYAPPDPLQDFYLGVRENALVLRRLIVQTTAMLDAKGVAGLPRSGVNETEEIAQRWREEGKIFSVTYGVFELYPAFQFEDGVPIPIVEAILVKLKRILTPWDIASWFVCGTGLLGRASPMDCLLTQPDEVLHAAEQQVLHYEN
jgi:hypothetical protein